MALNFYHILILVLNILILSPSISVFLVQLCLQLLHSANTQHPILELTSSIIFLPQQLHYHSLPAPLQRRHVVNPVSVMAFVYLRTTQVLSLSCFALGFGCHFAEEVVAVEVPVD